jgi:hypothetical protein
MSFSYFEGCLIAKAWILGLLKNKAKCSKLKGIPIWNLFYLASWYHN